VHGRGRHLGGLAHERDLGRGLDRPDPVDELEGVDQPPFGHTVDEGAEGARGEEVRVHLDPDRRDRGPGDLPALAQGEGDPVEGVDTGTLHIALGIADDVLGRQPGGLEGTARAQNAHEQRQRPPRGHEEQLRGVEGPGVVPGQIVDVRRVRDDERGEALVDHAIAHRGDATQVLLCAERQRARTDRVDLTGYRLRASFDLLARTTLFGPGPHPMHIRPIVLASVEKLTLIHDYSLVIALTACQRLMRRVLSGVDSAQTYESRMNLFHFRLIPHARLRKSIESMVDWAETHTTEVKNGPV